MFFAIYSIHSKNPWGSLFDKGEMINTYFIVLSVVDTYPELFQREIFSLVDAVVVDKYYLLSLTPESTAGMEVTSRLWHETVYGILLSNTTDDLVNCALDIVHKKRIELFTALHLQLNALQVSIKHNANEMHIHSPTG